MIKNLLLIGLDKHSLSIILAIKHLLGTSNNVVQCFLEVVSVNNLVSGLNEEVDNQDTSIASWMGVSDISKSTVDITLGSGQLRPFGRSALLPFLVSRPFLPLSKKAILNLASKQVEEQVLHVIIVGSAQEGNTIISADISQYLIELAKEAPFLVLVMSPLIEGNTTHQVVIEKLYNIISSSS